MIPVKNETIDKVILKIEVSDYTAGVLFIKVFSFRRMLT